MKDIPCLQLQLKFGPKTYKSLITCTCPKLVCCQNQHASPLEVKPLIFLFTKSILPKGFWSTWVEDSR